jgi:hypothetical protein
MSVMYLLKLGRALIIHQDRVPMGFFVISFSLLRELEIQWKKEFFDESVGERIAFNLLGGGTIFQEESEE